MIRMQANEHNQALIDANRDRLQVLELQAATYGNETPPHILTEMRKIVATIRALSTVVDLTPEIDPNADPSTIARDQVERRRDASTNEQATLRMIATVQATVAEVGNVKSALRADTNRLEAHIADVRAQVATVQTDVRKQLDDAKERVNHQIASIEASVASVQAVVLTEVQGIHTTIDKIVRTGIRVIGAIVLIFGLVAIVLFIYYRI